MKPIPSTIYATALFAFAGLGVGHAQWTAQTKPAGAIGDLASVYFLDANHGYAVGGYGSAIRTNDGGLTWENKSFGGGFDTYGSIHCTDSITCYLGGNTGKMLKTADGGTTFTPMTSGVTQNIMSMQFTSASTGYALVGTNGGFVKSVLLKTVDAGATWKRMDSSVTALNKAYFADATTGFAVGIYGRILKTTDGGATFATFKIDTTVDLQAVFFLNATIGFVAGNNGQLLKTVDGGTSWTALKTGVTQSIRTVFFTDENTGYFAGDGQMEMQKTTDGGASWTKQKVTFDYSFNKLTSICFPDPSTGYAVGPLGIRKTAPVAVPSGLPNQVRNGKAAVDFFRDPAGNFLILETIPQPEMTVSVYSLQGNLLRNVPVSGLRTAVDIHGLTKGLYVVQLKNPTTVVAKSLFRN